jgi:hypothetical protein
MFLTASFQSVFNCATKKCFPYELQMSQLHIININLIRAPEKHTTSTKGQTYKSPSYKWAMFQKFILNPFSFKTQNTIFSINVMGIGLNCGQESIHSSAVCGTLIKLTLLIVVVSDDVKAISLFLCRDNRCLINMQSSSSAIVVS